ncbi:MAG: LamG domain-containing protein, partial [Planctomycetes bacterium]|nr:LamG domain-containing protein [Planctomycetota bacterium]
FTMNATPVSFDNDVAYLHYQLIFTAIRGPVGGSVNSMQIAEVELIGVPGAPPSVTELVAQWTLDDGAGTVAVDSSGNGLDGVLNGEPLWVAGIMDGALELDGVDDYVDLGNPSSLDFGSGDFTISAWVNLTAIERATVYAKGGDNSGGIRYTLAMGESNDNKMTLTTDDDSSKRQAKGETVVNDGAWHHVAGMRSGAVSLVYVDGALDGSIELPEDYDLSGASQHNALIGAITSNTDGSLEKLFAGTIDDVRIYNGALSETEILELAGL